MSSFASVSRVVGLVIVVLFVCLIAYLFIGWPKTYPKTYGITWSAPYARYLGIDPIKGLIAALDELHVRHFRIPAYWNELEPMDGKYDWALLDEELDAIRAREGTVILVIGAKQPRWPECWYPEWVKSLNSHEREQKQLAYVKEVVQRYRNRPGISWQIENEPTFFSSFGECGLFDKKIVPKETALVHEIDGMVSGLPAHPILTTASGELSLWTLPAKEYTGLGVSVYRVIANSWTDRWSYWFIPPWFYARKAHLFPAGLLLGGVYVSEFQMEPWVLTDIRTLDLKKQFHTFDLPQMKENKLFADRINLPRVYFWGAEWWYWMKANHQHPEFWDEASSWFKEN